jgi:hypothetical protein
MGFLRRKRSRICLFTDYRKSSITNHPTSTNSSDIWHDTSTLKAEHRVDYMDKEIGYIDLDCDDITVHEVDMLGVVLSCQWKVVHVCPPDRIDGYKIHPSKFTPVYFHTPAMESLHELSPPLFAIWLVKLLESSFWN